MKLLTQSIRERLIRNGEIMAQAIDFDDGQPDFFPVVKLFTPDASCTWLLTEIDADDHDIAFGLCDLGMGCPELGTIRISELEALRGKLGLPVERDQHFLPRKTISEYAELARRDGCIKA